MSLPETIHIAEFVLSVDEPGGEQTAAKFRELLQQEFFRLQPTLGLIYELEIEESEVWVGSRKSRNKVRLRRKGGGRGSNRRQSRGALTKVLQRVVLVLGLVSMDYEKLGYNLVKAYGVVVEQLGNEGQRVEIESIAIHPRREEDDEDDPRKPGK